MKANRRHFLKLGFLHAAFFAANPLKNSPQIETYDTAQNSSPSILQGATDENKTQFSVVFSKNVNLEFMATDENNQKIFPDFTDVIDFPNHPQLITKTYFSGLVPTKNYQLHVIDSSTQKCLDKRMFQTLDLSKKDLKFAIVSCMKAENHKAALWDDMRSQNPDVIFFVGDSVYADSNLDDGARPEHLWDRFCEARSILRIYHQERLTPIMAVWDDHDFGKNNTGNKYPFIAESQKNFYNFFAQDESHCSVWKRGPGVSAVFRFSNQIFILLDDRSFRNEGKDTRYAYWGQEQEEWMLNLIQQHSGPIWLMNGNQFFPITGSDSVAKEYSMQFNAILKAIRQLHRKVTFVSGDVHYSELSQIEADILGYPTYEITSSGMHSKCNVWEPHLVPNRRRVASTGKRNYVMVDLEMSSNTTKVKVQSRDKDGDVNFKCKWEIR